MMNSRYGFVGLGQMGGPMAANIADGGFNLSVFDKAGTADRAPKNASVISSLDQLAARTDTLFLSLPDASASLEVAQELAARTEHAALVVIDLSTIGLEAAREAWKILNAVGITYIDAPVSGGQSGARAGKRDPASGGCVLNQRHLRK